LKKEAKLPASVHQNTITELLYYYPEAKTRGFSRAIRDVQKRSGFHPDGYWRGGVIPDLWWIDEQCMSVFVIEVEDSSKVSGEKLERYRDLHYLLDEEYWSAHLIAADRWGNFSPVPLYPIHGVGAPEMFAALFELVRICCTKDPVARAASRKKWLAQNPGFDRSNFYAKQRLARRKAFCGNKARPRAA
jgi:hypothetical protein